MAEAEFRLNYEGLRFIEKYKDVIESGGNFLEMFRKKDLSSIEEEIIIHDIELMKVVITSLNNTKDGFERGVRKLDNSLKEPFLFLPKEIQGAYRERLSEGENCIIFLNQFIGQLENYKEKYQKEFEGR